MGASGIGAFENDSAADWVAELADMNSLDYVQDALQAVVNQGDNYLDSDFACNALAACEVIARLKGNWGIRDPFSEEVDQWVETHKLVPSQELVDLAIHTIDRILTEPSELLELWEEVDENGKWLTSVNELRRRVLD